ncbi:hypothetical protein RJ639_003145 [Escallonia herrerae]|uniref:Uncharacterized protein n=1 Tax=Escallonia herrerae TaxID=1293975 RepID=A0AA89AYY4_9ASTE|nr:hypothetical protein RJ639_003145 [Escallonia herrerae]
MKKGWVLLKTTRRSFRSLPNSTPSKACSNEPSCCLSSTFIPLIYTNNMPVQMDPSERYCYNPSLRWKPEAHVDRAEDAQAEGIAGRERTAMREETAVPVKTTKGRNSASPSSRA